MKSAFLLLGMAASAYADCVGDTGWSEILDNGISGFCSDDNGECAGGESCTDPTDVAACLAQCIVHCPDDSSFITFNNIHGRCYKRFDNDNEGCEINDDPSYNSYGPDAACAAAGDAPAACAGYTANSAACDAATTAVEYQNAGCCTE